VLAATIFSAPFFQGLYFEKQRLASCVLVSCAAALSVRAQARGRDFAVSRFPGTHLGVAALAVAVAYWLAVPLAVYRKAAVVEALVATMLFGMTWLVYDCCGEVGGSDLLLGAVALSGTVVATLGLTTATRVLPYPGAWVGGRLASTLQYANTAASVLMAAFFASSTLWVKSLVQGGSPPSNPGSWGGLPAAWGIRLAWSANAGFLLAAFVLTQSRGAWLVLPVAAVLFAWGQPRGFRISAIGCVASSVLLGIAAATKFSAALNPMNVGSAWRWVLLAPLCGAVGLNCLVSACDALGRARGAKLSAAAAGARFTGFPRMALVVAGLGAAVLLILPVAGVATDVKAIAAGPLKRVSSTVLMDRNVQERIIWTLDAVRIGLRRPITGAGGGGWATLYHKYKAFPYYTKLVHNHLAQVFVDAGIVGLAAYCVLWLSLLGNMRRALRLADDRLRVSAWGAGSAAICLGLHSVGDFSLSLPAVAAILWTLMGVVGGATDLAAETGDGDAVSVRSGPALYERAREVLARRGTVKAFLYAFVLSALVASTCLAGASLRSAGEGAWKEGEREVALSLVRRATLFDPLDASARLTLGLYFQEAAEERRDKDLMRDAVVNLETAVRLNPYDSVTRLHYAAVLLKTGQSSAALRHTAVAISNNRFMPEGYEVLTGMYLETGKRLALGSNVDEARQAFTRALEVMDLLEKAKASIPERFRKYSPPEGIAVTAVMRLYRAQAMFFLGQGGLMASELKEPLRSKVREISQRAELWSALGEIAAGKVDSDKGKVARVVQKAPDLEEELELVRKICGAMGLGYAL
jgi:tetratricopeptide (TPR) repeat protein